MKLRWREIELINGLEVGGVTVHKGSYLGLAKDGTMVAILDDDTGRIVLVPIGEVVDEYHAFDQ